MAAPKAEAIVVVDDIAIGVTALLLLAAAGVVFTPKDSDGIAAIGSSFKSSMYQWGTSAEKLDDVEEFFSDLILYEPSDPDDEGDEDPRLQVRLSRTILAGIASWICSVVLDMDSLLDPESEYNDGGFCEDYGLVALPSSFKFPYLIVTRLYSNYELFSSASPFVVSGDDLIIPAGCEFYSFYYYEGEWDTSVFGDTYVYAEDKILASHHYLGSKYTIVRLNYDILSTDGSCWKTASPGFFVDTSINLAYDIVSPLPDQLLSGEKDEDDIPLPDVLNYGALIQNGQSLEDSVMDTMQQLSDGSMTYESYVGSLFAEQPVWIKPLPVTATMTYRYAIGEKADTFTVEATGNSDGSGTVTYEWLDTSTVPYTVLGTGPSFTPDTSQADYYPLTCRATNIVPCSLVDGGYLYNSTYTSTYYIYVGDPVVDPGGSPGANPGDDPESDPDPGASSDTDAILDGLEKLEVALNPDSSSLLDSSQGLQSNSEAINSFEQAQLDDLEDSKHLITDAFNVFGEGSTLLAAFNLVTYILNGTYTGLGQYQVVIILPLALGAFLFVCSRVRGFDKPRKGDSYVSHTDQQLKVVSTGVGNDPKSPEV